MNYEDRGLGLFGMMRWEFYCLGMDPDALTQEHARKLLADQGCPSVSLNTSGPYQEMALECARQEWKTRVGEKSGPMKIHWAVPQSRKQEQLT